VTWSKGDRGGGGGGQQPITGRPYQADEGCKLDNLYFCSENQSLETNLKTQQGVVEGAGRVFYHPSLLSTDKNRRG